MVTVLVGGRSQKGNGLAWYAHHHLQIIRQGGLYYFRTSADGKHWQDMPGSPVERKDMAGIPLQVGLYHASYGGDSSFITFSDFKLTTLKMKRLLLPLLALSAGLAPASAALLDKQAQLDVQAFWDNRDWDWYKANIPFFECPRATQRWRVSHTA